MLKLPKRNNIAVSMNFIKFYPVYKSKVMGFMYAAFSMCNTLMNSRFLTFETIEYSEYTERIKIACKVHEEFKTRHLVISFKSSSKLFDIFLDMPQMLNNELEILMFTKKFKELKTDHLIDEKQVESNIDIFEIMTGEFLKSCKTIRFKIRVKILNFIIFKLFKHKLILPCKELIRINN